MFRQNLKYVDYMIKAKGHTIKKVPITSAFSRRALQFKNTITSLLQKIGVESEVDIPLEQVATTKAQASATWYLSGHKLHYSHSLQGRYIDNLYVLYKVLEIEVNLVLSGKKTLADFVTEFKEDDDVEAQRKDARALLGIDPTEKDLTVINAKYKQMAKDCHPDMPGGDTEKFKKLNNAHKVLQRELV